MINHYNIAIRLSTITSILINYKLINIKVIVPFINNRIPIVI